MMSSRHDRRRSVAAYRHEVARGGELRTHLLDAQLCFDHNPSLHRAIGHWRAQLFQRRPICISCRRSFADEVYPGAYLFSMSTASVGTVSVSGVCEACWIGEHALSDAEIEAHAMRVFRQILPGGRFVA